MYERLFVFKQKNNHCNVPQKYREDPDLGLWVFRQRLRYKAGKLNSDRQQRLKALDFVWQAGGTSWEEHFLKLIEYKREHGHCNVSADENRNLTQWLKNQRHRNKHNRLNAERVKRLEEAGFVLGERTDERDHWETMFRELLSYRAARGDCNVPSKWEHSKLANWVTGLRRAKRYKSKNLTLQRVGRLDEIGFVWDHKRNRRTWEEMFSGLQEYERQHGDCNVPHPWPENQKLRWWVQNQRSAKKANTLGEDRIRRLNEIQFQWELSREERERVGQ